MIIYICVCFAYMQILYSCLMAENLLVQSKSKSLSPQEVPFSSKFRKGFKTHPLQKQQNANVPVTTQIQNAAGSICWC